MDRFITYLFQDPILLITALVFLVTVAILIWALNTWRNADPMSESISAQDEEDEEPLDEESESSGLVEARLQEVSRQLGEISNRLADMEKKVSEQKTFDRTVQTTAQPGVAPAPADIERLVKRLESKIETLSNEKSQLPSDSIVRLESRLEGIHRLLILLTEGNENATGK